MARDDEGRDAPLFLRDDVGVGDGWEEELGGSKRRRNALGEPASSTDVGGRVGALMDGLRRGAGLPAGVFKTLELWGRMGDERLRRHVVSVSIRQNRATRELLAYVDGSVWVSEFTMMRTAVLVEWNNLCDLAGESDLRVQKVTFKLGKAARAAGATGAISTGNASGADALPVELNAEERARVRAACADVTDDSLRRQIMKAMTRVMEWQKGEDAARRRGDFSQGR